MTGGAERGSNELAVERTDLALIRTVVALDRTLMAWIRTATSLISFGFTIYKFFQGLRDAQTIAAERRLLDPADVALVMIALGVGSLLVATFQYRSQLNALKAAYGPTQKAFDRKLTVSVAAIMTGLGIVGFVLVLVRQ